MDERQQRIYTFMNAGQQRAGSAWRVASSQPSWVARAAAVAFLLVVLVPLLLLFSLAVLAALAVFGVLAGANWLMNTMRSALPSHDGRENVRVIQKHDSR